MSMRVPQALTLRCDLHLQRQNSGRLQLRLGRAPETKTIPVGRVSRIARLMALAIRFEDLLRRGDVKDYAELAHVGHVTRARVTQIMNLLNLAPDIQEQILFLPLVIRGRDPLKEWQVRPLAAEAVWATQRGMWKKLSLLTTGAA